jgi:hypothetical protein
MTDFVVGYGHYRLFVLFYFREIPGFGMSLSPSPSKLNPIVRTMIIAPGIVTSHQRSREG